MKNERDIKLKTGEVVPAGTECTVKFEILTSPENPDVRGFFAIVSPHCGVRDFRVRARNLSFYFPKNFKTPTLRTLEKWATDGVARSMLGRKVEPDGWDSDNSPSWLLALGLV